MIPSKSNQDPNPKAADPSQDSKSKRPNTLYSQQPILYRSPTSRITRFGTHSPYQRHARRGDTFQNPFSSPPRKYRQTPHHYSPRIVPPRTIAQLDASYASRGPFAAQKRKVPRTPRRYTEAKQDEAELAQQEQERLNFVIAQSVKASTDAMQNQIDALRNEMYHSPLRHPQQGAVHAQPEVRGPQFRTSAVEPSTLAPIHSGRGAVQFSRGRASPNTMLPPQTAQSHSQSRPRSGQQTPTRQQTQPQPQTQSPMVLSTRMQHNVGSGIVDMAEDEAEKAEKAVDIDKYVQRAFDQRLDNDGAPENTKHSNQEPEVTEQDIVTTYLACYDYEHCVMPGCSKAVEVEPVSDSGRMHLACCSEHFREAKAIGLNMSHIRERREERREAKLEGEEDPFDADVVLALDYFNEVVTDRQAFINAFRKSDEFLARFEHASEHASDYTDDSDDDKDADVEADDEKATREPAQTGDITADVIAAFGPIAHNPEAAPDATHSASRPQPTTAQDTSSALLKRRDKAVTRAEKYRKKGKKANQSAEWVLKAYERDKRLAEEYAQRVEKSEEEIQNINAMLETVGVKEYSYNDDGLLTLDNERGQDVLDSASMVQSETQNQLRTAYSPFRAMVLDQKGESRLTKVIVLARSASKHAVEVIAPEHGKTGWIATDSLRYLTPQRNRLNEYRGTPAPPRRATADPAIIHALQKSESDKDSEQDIRAMASPTNPFTIDPHIGQRHPALYVDSALIYRAVHIVQQREKAMLIMFAPNAKRSNKWVVPERVYEYQEHLIGQRCHVPETVEYIKEQIAHREYEQQRGTDTYAYQYGRDGGSDPRRYGTAQPRRGDGGRRGSRSGRRDNGRAGDSGAFGRGRVGGRAQGAMGGAGGAGGGPGDGDGDSSPDDEMAHDQWMQRHRRADFERAREHDLRRAYAQYDEPHVREIYELGRFRHGEFDENHVTYIAAMYAQQIQQQSARARDNLLNKQIAQMNDTVNAIHYLARINANDPGALERLLKSTKYTNLGRSTYDGRALKLTATFAGGRKAESTDLFPHFWKRYTDEVSDADVPLDSDAAYTGFKTCLSGEAKATVRLCQHEIDHYVHTLQHPPLVIAATLLTIENVTVRVGRKLMLRYVRIRQKPSEKLRRFLLRKIEELRHAHFFVAAANLHTFEHGKVVMMTYHEQAQNILDGIRSEALITEHMRQLQYAVNCERSFNTFLNQLLQEAEHVQYREAYRRDNFGRKYLELKYSEPGPVRKSTGRGQTKGGGGDDRGAGNARGNRGAGNARGDRGGRGGGRRGGGGDKVGGGGGGKGGGRANARAKSGTGGRGGGRGGRGGDGRARDEPKESYFARRKRERLEKKQKREKEMKAAKKRKEREKEYKPRDAGRGKRADAKEKAKAKEKGKGKGRNQPRKAKGGKGKGAKGKKAKAMLMQTESGSEPLISDDDSLYYIHGRGHPPCDESDTADEIDPEQWAAAMRWNREHWEQHTTAVPDDIEDDLEDLEDDLGGDPNSNEHAAPLTRKQRLNVAKHLSRLRTAQAVTGALEDLADGHAISAISASKSSTNATAQESSTSVERTSADDDERPMAKIDQSSTDGDGKQNERTEAQLIRDLLIIAGTEDEVRESTTQAMLRLGLGQMQVEFSKVKTFAVVLRALLGERIEALQRIKERLLENKIITDKEFEEILELLDQAKLIHAKTRPAKQPKYASDIWKKHKKRKGKNNRTRRWDERREKRERKARERKGQSHSSKSSKSSRSSRRSHKRAKRNLFRVYNTLERADIEHFGKARDDIPLSAVLPIDVAANRHVRGTKDSLMDTGATMSTLNGSFIDRVIERVQREREQRETDSKRADDDEQTADTETSLSDESSDEIFEHGHIDAPVSRLIPDGPVVAQKGQAMMVQNGGGEDIEWDGTFYWLWVRHPAYKNVHIKMPFYRSPKELPYDIIIGRRGMLQLGLRVRLTNAIDTEVVYHHPRENVLYDVSRDSNTWQMMDYCHGNSLSELIDEGRARAARAERKDDSADATADDSADDSADAARDSTKEALFALCGHDRAVRDAVGADNGSRASMPIIPESDDDDERVGIEVGHNHSRYALYIDDDDVYRRCVVDKQSGPMMRLLVIGDDGERAVGDGAWPRVIVHEDRVKKFDERLEDQHVHVDSDDEKEQHSDDERESSAADEREDELYHFSEHFREICADNVVEDIRKIVADVKRRRGHEMAVRMKRILTKHQTRLAASKFDIGRIEGVEYEIPLIEGATPVRSQPYNTSPPQQDKIDETVDALVQCGFVEEVTGRASWASPVIMIQNNDGSWRFCVDYKRRNAQTISNAYPCPNINDALLRFRGRRVFSKFDLCKAFHNIRVKEEHKDRTTFVTKRGVYRWVVMPFGGKNAPATWARASDHVFARCKDLIKYVDDLAVASYDDESHIVAIEQFFETLTDANLKVKLSKCQFFRSEIQFVGHTITHNKISANRQYIDKIIKLKPPRNKAEVGSYVGIVSWLTKYCPKLKEALLPIARLKKKKVRWNWDAECERAHLLIKAIISNAEPLAQPDWSQPFTLYTDAIRS